MRKGFTLIELAIALVLIGLLLGFGTSLIGILIKQVKHRETQERLDAAVESVIGYACTHKYLPDNATFPKVVRTPNDIYGKPFKYIYYSRLSGPTGYCGKKSSPITVRICHDAACTSYEDVSNVAFVIVSGGENYNIQTYIPSPPGVSTAVVIKVYDYGLQVDDYPADMNRVEDYDDLVKWVTLAELRQKADCKPLTITSPDVLPAAEEDAPYSYQLEAEGGKPGYTWSGTVGGGLSLETSGRVWGTVNLNSATSTGELNSCNGTITFNATVTDTVGDSDWKIFTIPVKPRSLIITTDHIPYGYVGSKYSAIISAEGGVLSSNLNYEMWTLVGTEGKSCPHNIKLYKLNNVRGSAELVVDEELEKEGNCIIEVKVEDACGNSYSRRYTLTINPAYTSGNGTGGGGGSACTSYEVYNHCSRRLYWGCSCRAYCVWRYGNTKQLANTVIIYKRSRGTCVGEGEVSLANAASADRDGDCKVQYVCGSSLEDY